MRVHIFLAFLLGAIAVPVTPAGESGMDTVAIPVDPDSPTNPIVAGSFKGRSTSSSGGSKSGGSSSSGSKGSSGSSGSKGSSWSGSSSNANNKGSSADTGGGSPKPAGVVVAPPYRPPKNAACSLRASVVGAACVAAAVIAAV
ncbi:hypothetical protein CspeluHIS016_0208380 [Cutaneotrichosporon spelunceum]|uniref:Uncharacterized protein n=1 Tax=Cutaneotrichosporon spelunceum TaxID=1672016 RepID=A0AAD3TSM5_9TREE|nr:hypothetical protein CspeluHIS016_0208380 [Cutaneotrichosporon spelunceum]